MPALYIYNSVTEHKPSGFVRDAFVFLQKKLSVTINWNAFIMQIFSILYKHFLIKRYSYSCFLEGIDIFQRFLSPSLYVKYGKHFEHSPE